MGYRVEETIEADSKASAADEVATRVNGESIEMLSPQAVPVAEWAAFEMRLSTGDVFLEGMGRCEACAASGDRHRVRLGTLQFDVMNELMFERIQLAAESIVSGERTGEVDIAALEAMRKAEQAPKPSPSMAPVISPPPKPAAPMDTPSWRPPPPLRTRAAAPPAVKAKPAPPPPVPISTEPLAPEATRAQFTPSGFPPPLPKPPPAPPAPEPPAAAESPASESSAAESPAGESPASDSPASESPAAESPAAESIASTPEAKEVSTVSGFPAPPAEPSQPKLGAFASEPRFSSIPPKKSDEDEREPTPRERLEPLLLAMRRAGAARHVEDAEAMALELGLQTLEAIFGE